MMVVFGGALRISEKQRTSTIVENIFAIRVLAESRFHALLYLWIPRQIDARIVEAQRFRGSAESFQWDISVNRADTIGKKVTVTNEEHRNKTTGVHQRA